MLRHGAQLLRRRQGNKDVKLRISAELDDDIPRFKLAPPLAALLGKGVDSRDNVLRALASYIRTHGLQVGAAGHHFVYFIGGSALKKLLLSCRRLLLAPQCMLKYSRLHAHLRKQHLLQADGSLANKQT